MNDVSISMKTVRMFKRIMRPIAEEGIIPLAEYNEATSQLTSLAEHGTLKPVIPPRLINTKEASEILGIDLSNFKKLESEGRFPLNGRWLALVSVIETRIFINSWQTVNNHTGNEAEAGHPGSFITDLSFDKGGGISTD